MMLRKAQALPSYGVRFNSTAANRHWVDVMLPSRPLKLRKVPKKNQMLHPDLSYLQTAPQDSLAGRLAKPTLHSEKTNLGRAPIQESTWETVKIDIDAITQKRKEERLARESFEKKIAAANQKRAEARIGRQFNQTIRTVEDNADKLNSLGLLHDSPGPLPLVQSAKPNDEIPDSELSPIALRRRQERRLRESASNQEYRRYRDDTLFNNMDTETETENDTPGIEMMMDRAELEESSPIAEAPKFNGPEPISETFDDDFYGTVEYHPPIANGHGSDDVSKSPSCRLNPNLIDSLVEGNYSEYTSFSSSISNSTSPNALTAVNTAELALSHQRDYIIPQRDKAIEIVKYLVEGKFVQDTKRRQELT